LLARNGELLARLAVGRGANTHRGKATAYLAPRIPSAEARDVLDPTTYLAADQLAADDQLSDQWRPGHGSGVPRHAGARLGAALQDGRGYSGTRAAGLRRAGRGCGAVCRATSSLAGRVDESVAAAGGGPPGRPGRTV